MRLPNEGIPHPLQLAQRELGCQQASEEAKIVGVQPATQLLKSHIHDLVVIKHQRDRLAVDEDPVSVLRIDLQLRPMSDRDAPGPSPVAPTTMA
ncbi:MAG: hypothetical protein ACR2HR_05000 [Euzebya sp.]